MTQPRGESKTSQRRLAAAERRRQALELRKAGVTFEDIAQRVGYKSRQAAFEAVNAALRQMIEEPTSEVRQLDIQRLDTLLMRLWPQANADNPHIVDRVLRILERRARLMGLDAPTKIANEDNQPFRVAHSYDPAEALSNPRAARLVTELLGELSHDDSETQSPNGNGAYQSGDGGAFSRWPG